MYRGFAWTTLLCALLTLSSLGLTAERLPRELEGITVEEHLDQPVDLDTEFQDSTGKAVRLKDFFDGKRPVLLTLNYYRCPMLCNLQLNGLTEGLKGLEWAPGQHYRIVTISIDPRENAELAQGKRASHLRQLGKGDVDWSFLVGTEKNIRSVAKAIGFGFRYDPAQDQFAHPAVVTFLSPDGRVMRYLYGLEYSSRDLKFALIEASQGRAGSAVDRLILSCFHYDATVGRYGPFAFGIMRLAGGVTVLVLGVFLTILWRRDAARARTRPKEAT